jgi:hypothetical protein
MRPIRAELGAKRQLAISKWQLAQLKLASNAFSPKLFSSALAVLLVKG